MIVNIKHKIKGTSLVQKILLWRQVKDLRIKLNDIDLENSHGFVVNLLICGKKQYAFLGEICIRSFLLHHPNAVFRVYVDGTLFDRCSDQFGDLINLNKLSITKLSGRVVDSWQKSKLDILLKMNGTNEIFMDADLRWNGALSDINGVTSYLEEFDLFSSLDYSIHLSDLPKIPNCNMLNLSFFTFGEVTIPEIISKRILDLQMRIASTEGFDSESNPNYLSTARMSEQIALSYFLHEKKVRINYLKEDDSRNDGKFVESCYFGATGLIY